LETWRNSCGEAHFIKADTPSSLPEPPIAGATRTPRAHDSAHPKPNHALTAFALCVRIGLNPANGRKELDDVAHRLGTSIRTLERKRADGTGPRFVRVGRLVRYTDPDVDAWITAQTVASTSEARS
jgi:predicted DNA-binding transcriptional regulator AlpA